MKTFSHLKHQASHQPEPKALTEFQHYTGPFGTNVQMQATIRKAPKKSGKGY